MTARFAVLGEALVDVDAASGTPRAGGSPLNVAVGLARLGQPTAFAGRLGGDEFGALLRGHARESGVDLSLVVAAAQPSTTALVVLDAAGSAHYEFTVTGTADFAWTDAELARVPGGANYLHFGSLASWLPPGDAAIDRRLAALHAGGDVLISYDPNVRPALQPDAGAAREVVERSLRHAHVVKASEDDVRWLYGQTRTDEVAARWLRCGPALVVLTLGARGQVAFRNGHPQASSPAPPVTVVDTVGAGDAFTSGLLDALARRDIDAARVGRVDTATLTAILDDAALVAAITCTRVGADPPSRAELDAWRAR